MNTPAALETAARTALARHPIAVDCVRAADELVGADCDVVVFGSNRAFVVATSDIARIMQPRPLSDSEVALIGEPSAPAVTEISSAFPIMVAGELVGALSTTIPVDAEQAAVLEPLSRVVASVVTDEAASPQGFETAVLQGLRDSVIVLSADLTVRWANRSIGSLLGRTPVEVIGISAADLVHPDDLGPAIDAIANMREGRQMYRVFLRLERGDGVYERVEITGVDHSGNDEINGIVISLRNANRQNELERSIDRSSSMSAAVIASLYDGIVATDEFGDITNVNSAAREMFGIDPDSEISELSLDDFPVIDSTGRRRVIATTADRVTEHHVRTDHITAERITGGNSNSDEDDVWMVVGPNEVRYVSFDRAPVFNSDEELIGSVLAFHDRTAERAARAELQSQALHDQLTGLANRRQLEQRIATLSATPEPTLVAAIFIDLDAFKLVNDTHGHRLGDQLIRIAATRLQSELRSDDLLVRQGGDEFVVLQMGIGSIEKAEETGERLREALSFPFEIDEQRFDITASLGVAVAMSDELADETVLQHADIALYAAKARGRDRVEIFNDDLAAAVSLEEHQRRILRSALEHDRLVMHFQPLVEAKTGLVRGYEALARVRTEDGDLVGPAGFMDAVTSTGLIWDLDRAAFSLSCQAAAIMADLEPDDPPTIACNFSSFSLTQPGFVDTVIETATSHDIDFGQICIEITESAAFEGGASTLDSLMTLSAAGFQLALDDFGTGYSSLAHLRDLPISSVKVDKSFVSKLSHGHSERAIADAVVTLAHDLGLGVVAEGVETKEHLEQVRELGFNTVQGWHYAAAMPLSEALAERHTSSGASRE